MYTNMGLDTKIPGLQGLQPAKVQTCHLSYWDNVEYQKFVCNKWSPTFQKMDYKGADQTVQMSWMVCGFVAHM